MGNVSCFCKECGKNWQLLRELACEAESQRKENTTLKDLLASRSFGSPSKEAQDELDEIAKLLNDKDITG